LTGIRVDVRLDATVPPDARCSALLETLEPILENAVRHTPWDGEVCVLVRLEPMDGQPGGRVVVDVSNTGAGVDPALQSHVFDAWASTRDASVAGGLGLWLARETARDHGGDVLLTAPGPGTTTFRVELPTTAEAPRPA
jgi:signal transduction histidine kinase